MANENDDDPLEGRIREHWQAHISASGAWRTVAGNDLDEVLDRLNRGTLRVAEQDRRAEHGWRVKEWVKQGLMLYFILNSAALIEGPLKDNRYDIFPSKFLGWLADQFNDAGIRVARGSIVRKGAFISKRVVLMPSFVNVGAYIGEGTMIDTWASVGSCAQIGNNVHISGGVGIGGVFEPVQARPTIIEDGCFIGARSEVSEGVVIKRGAVLSMGVFIGANTPIVNHLDGGKIIHGYVPENVVVMMGVHPGGMLNCPHIVKFRDEKTDAKVALNEALREFH